jgi:hypothetical protein
MPFRVFNPCLSNDTCRFHGAPCDGLAGDVIRFAERQSHGSKYSTKSSLAAITSRTYKPNGNHWPQTQGATGRFRPSLKVQFATSMPEAYCNRPLPVLCGPQGRDETGDLRRWGAQLTKLHRWAESVRTSP